MGENNKVKENPHSFVSEYMGLTVIEEKMYLDMLPILNLPKKSRDSLINIEEAIQAIQNALDLIEDRQAQLSDKFRMKMITIIFDVTNDLVRELIQTQLFDHALKTIILSASIAEEMSNETFLAEYHYWMGLYYFEIWNPGDAVRELKKAIRIFKKHNLLVFLESARNFLARIEDNLNQAKLIQEKSEKEEQQAKFSVLAPNVRILKEKGDFNGAFKVLKKMYSFTLGYRALLEIYSLEGEVYYAQKHFKEGIESYRKAYDIYAGYRDRKEMTRCLNLMSIGYEKLGDKKAYQRIAFQVAELMRENGDDYQYALSLGRIGEMLKNNGEVSTARAFFQEGLYYLDTLPDHMVSQESKKAQEVFRAMILVLERK